MAAEDVDPRELEPLELLVQRVADIEGVEIEDEELGLFVLGPGAFVCNAAATGVFTIYAQNVVSGRTHALEPGHLWGGWLGLDMQVEMSLAIFDEGYEPFGDVWVPLTLEACVERVEHWRFCHRLSREVPALGERLRTLHEDVEATGVVTPVYVLAMLGEKLGEGEKAVRREQRAQRRGGRIAKRAATAQRASAQVDGMLMTDQLAQELGVTSQTVRRWRSDGRGPPWVKIGEGEKGRVGYRREAVDRWLAGRESGVSGARKRRKD